MRLMLSGIGKPMGHGRSLATVIATEFAISATPAGSGGLLTYAYLLKRHGAPGTAAAAMYATDIMIDIQGVVGSSPIVPTKNTRG